MLPRHPGWILLPAFGLSLSFFALTAIAPAQPRNDQDPSQTSQPAEPFTFKVPVNVVLIKVRVTDRRGTEVKDLTVEDFKVYEDGKLQAIQSFELESTQPVVRTQPVDRASGQERTEASRVQTQADSSGERTRFISCFIDDITALSPRNHYWAISAVQKFLAEEMGPHDRVGIFSASGGVRIPFTSDKALLQSQTGDLHIGQLNLSRPYRSDCPVMTDVQAKRIADGPRGISFERAMREALLCIGVEGLDSGEIERHVRAEAYHQYQGAQSAIHRLLANLRQHLRYLQHFKASKSLVLFSDGFVPGRSTRWRLDRVVDRALRSRVVFNVIDTRGLYTVGFDASSNDQVRNASPYGLSREEFIFGLDIGQELSGLYLNQAHLGQPLEKLAAETGGVYFHDNNDLVAGLRQISNAQSHHYLLSYSSPNQKANGRYHKIKVEVNRPGLEFSHRRGYFAPREETSFEERKNEDIQLALQAPGDFDQIPVQLAYQYSRLPGNLFRLSLFTQVRIEGMKFFQENGRHRNLLHLVMMVHDEEDGYVEGSEKAVKLDLTKPSYLAMLERGFTSKVEVDLPAGRYKVKAVVRESNQTKMGTVRQTVTLPAAPDVRESSPNQIGSTNQTIGLIPSEPGIDSERAEQYPLAPPLDSLESSSLVLSQQLTPMADLSADLQQSLRKESDSLIFKDMQVHRPVDDRIAREFPVTFFYRLYNLNYSEQTAGLTARVQLTDERGTVRRFRPIPLGESKTHSFGQGQVSVAFNLSFKDVEPGRYTLTLMTTAPAANGQSVGRQATVTVEP